MKTPLTIEGFDPWVKGLTDMELTVNRAEGETTVELRGRVLGKDLWHFSRETISAEATPEILRHLARRQHYALITAVEG